MIMNPGSKISWLACALIALIVPAVASAADCKVVASEELRYPSLIASYSGDCKNGRAEGQGIAKWTHRHYPDKPPVVWQGRFVDGIYLSEPGVLGARHLEYSQVLLDLGSLAGPGDIGHLWAYSRAEGELPPLACHSRNLHVGTQGPLHDDDVARRWLDAAYQRWRRLCSTETLGADRDSRLRVELYEGNDWIPTDWYKRRSVVWAYTALGTNTVPAIANWQSYNNRPAEKIAAEMKWQAWEAELQAELQANEKRLRDFAHAVAAKRFVSLDALQQNPFRFGDEVLLVDLRLQEARTPTEAVVRGTTGYGGGGLLHGDIARWDNASRIAAVRVKGRSEEPDTKGKLLLQLIDSRVCDRRDCDDFLVMPDKRRLRESEF